MAEFGRRTGLRIRRGNPWGFESPLSHHLKNLSTRIGNEPFRMKKKLLFVVAVACALVIVQIYDAPAQYYSYYYPYYYAPPGYYPPPATKQSRPVTPNYFRMTPDPYQAWRWDRHNRWEDYQHSLWSPRPEGESRLNPETDLSYMLRTF